MDEDSENHALIVENGCNYIDCCDFLCKHDSKLSLLHVNSRSLFKNFEELVTFLATVKHNFSVIGISETWFKPSTDTALFHIPEYSLVQVCRQTKRGGGVALYIRDGLEYNVCKDLSKANMGYESIYIEFVVNKIKTVVGCVYRAPGNSVRSFVLDFEQDLQILCSGNKNIYIMGDFNINLLNYDSDDRVKDFVDILTSFGLFSLITKPTRSSSSTLIDNIFTNCVQDAFESGIFCSDLSDHKPIFSINKKQTLITVKSNSDGYKRLITEAKIESFRQDLLASDWSYLYTLVNAEESYNYFLSIFSRLYDIRFPIVKINRKRKCRKPWITQSLLKSIEHKYKLYYTYIKCKNERNKKKYLDYKNVLTNLVRKSKKDYYDKVFKNTQKDIRKTWVHINELLGRGNRELMPDQLYHGETLLVSDLQKAEYFNKYFINLPDNISKEIPEVQTSFKDYMPRLKYASSLFVRPTTVCEIITLVSSLDASKSSGSDEISPKVIKGCIQVIADLLCHVFNTSISQGIVPTKLKISKIVPVYKKK